MQHPATGETGYDLWVGGGLSTNPMIAQRLGTFVKPEQVPEVWAAVASLFRDYGYRRLRHRARIKFLVADWGAERFREVLEKEYLGYALPDGPAPVNIDAGVRDHIGVHPQKDGLAYVGFAPKVGRLNGDALHAIAALADKYGSGRVRTTTEQKMVILDVPPARTDDLAAELEAAGLPVKPTMFRRHTMACTGIEFCKLAIVETKARASSLIDELERRLPGFDTPVTINVNGCPNSCARIQTADIGLKGSLVTDDVGPAGRGLPGPPRRDAARRRRGRLRIRPEGPRPEDDRRRTSRLRGARAAPLRSRAPGRRDVRTRGRCERPTRSCHDQPIRAGSAVLLPVLRRGGPRTPGRGGRRMALPQLHKELPATLCRDRSRAVTTVGLTLGGLEYPFGPASSDLDDERGVEDPRHMRSLAEQAAEELEDASAEDIIRWATDTFGDRICVTSSMTDAVIIHLASAIRPGIDVVFLDTGYHFPETIGTRDAVYAVYPVNLVNVTPSRTVEEQDAELGPRLYGRNPDLCCYLRKVEPLERALSGYDAWITGVRREETTSRRSTPVVDWDEKREMVKVNPIVSWTGKQVDDYIATNGVLVNPLVYDGYPSIGCRTCTLRVESGADPRSGRWAGTGKTECGIHV